MGKKPLILKKRSDIQFLRALAVIGVVLFHAYPNSFSRGFLGVDLFFLISGYLIFPQLIRAISAENKAEVQKELKQFLTRRLRRIAPALGFSITIGMILSYFFLPPGIDYAKKQILQSVFTLIGMGNLVALRQSGDYFNSDSPFVHYWTLGVELQIYIFGAIFSYLLYQFQRRRLDLKIDKAFRNCLVVITIGSIVTRIITFQFPFIFDRMGMQSFAIAPNSVDFYSSSNRLWEFSVGGLFALYSGKVLKVKMINFLLSQCKIYLIALTILLVFTPITIVNTAITTTIMLVVAGTYLVAPQMNNYKSWIASILVWIGDRSYSIYLFHLPLITIFGGPFVPINLRSYLIPVAIILTLIIGDISYTFVEKRYRYQENQTLSFDRKKSNKSISLINVSYTIPCLVILILVALSYRTQNDSLVTSEWNKSYAASDLFPCPLGQLNNPCPLNDKSGGKDWLLVGDSHAGALQQAINDVAISRSDNLKVWNKCRFFNPKLSKEMNSYFPDWCIEQNMKRIEYLDSENIDLLLIGYFDSEIKYGDKKLSSELWRDVFSETLRNLNIGRVLLISQVPAYLDTANSRPRISFPADKYVAISGIPNMSVTNKSADKEMAITGNVDYLDISTPYCNSERCIRKLKDWLYVDSNHLSIQGAKLMRPLLERYIDENL